MISGISLNFSGENAIVIAGTESLPHRTDLIEKKINKKDYNGLEKIFFNLKTKNCLNSSNIEQAKKEVLLFNKYRKEIEF